MPLLLCPNCNVGMLVVQRSGIELDTCPQCRGIWLDRGELEKLLQPIRDQMHTPESQGGNTRDAPSPFRNTPQSPYTQHHESSHHGHNKQDHDASRHYASDKGKHYRKKNPLESLFDIFD
ncbi:MAG: zf-TFIIB domain-containing protein [Nitrospirae bacterium]|nr:zf-TFIIB domain-containing protein [Magnetococcales bacterium]HAT49157.1 hypothetical protein [Alphaproteobacteria bacterium]